MPRPDELPPDRLTWVSRRPELNDRNKALKALIELKSRWMQYEEGEHRRRMQELAEQIKDLRTKLKEFEKEANNERDKV